MGTWLSPRVLRDRRAGERAQPFPTGRCVWVLTHHFPAVARPLVTVVRNLHAAPFGKWQGPLSLFGGRSSWAQIASLGIPQDVPPELGGHDAEGVSFREGSGHQVGKPRRKGPLELPLHARPLESCFLFCP